MELLKHIELSATQYLENQSYNLPQSSPNAGTGTSNPLYSAPFFHTAFQPYSNSLTSLSSPPQLSSPSPDIFHPNHPNAHLLSTYYVPYSSTANDSNATVTQNQNPQSSPIACISLSPIVPSSHSLLHSSSAPLSSSGNSQSSSSSSSFSQHSSTTASFSKRFQSRKIDVVRPTSIRIPAQPLTNNPLHSPDMSTHSHPSRSPLTPWSPFTPMSPLTPLSPATIFHHLPIKTKSEETILISGLPSSSIAVPVSQSNLQSIPGSIMPPSILNPVPLSSTPTRPTQVVTNPLAMLSFYSAQSPPAPSAPSTSPSGSLPSDTSSPIDKKLRMVTSLAITEQHFCHFPHCNKAFHKPSALKRHIRTHTGERPYICGFHGCGLSFAERGNLKRHERVHSGEKPHQCEHCGHHFARRCHLLQHYRAKHPSESKD